MNINTSPSISHPWSKLEVQPPAEKTEKEEPAYSIHLTGHFEDSPDAGTLMSDFRRLHSTLKAGKTVKSFEVSDGKYHLESGLRVEKETLLDDNPDTEDIFSVESRKTSTRVVYREVDGYLKVEEHNTLGASNQEQGHIFTVVDQAKRKVVDHGIEFPNGTRTSF